jgi:deazaflavin-dependent oxidoreductase (nitroreductase family)
MMRGLVLSLVLGAALLVFADEPPLPEVSAALERIRSASTVEITTVGRKTGKPHTRPVWFVVDDGKIVVQAGKEGKSDWYRNLQKNPVVTVRQGEYQFRTRAGPVTDPQRIDAIHQFFLKKYMSAWLLSFFGSSIGRGLPVVLDPQSVAIVRR